MPCSCIAHMHLLHTSCHPYHAMFYFMLLHHFDLLASLACHVFFILCSILFLRCFLFCLSFIFHSSCLSYASLSFFLSSFLSLIFLGPFVYSCQKGGEYTREYTKKYCHFYMALDHILKGRNFISCTFVGREIPYGRCIYQEGEDIFLWENHVLFYFTLCLFSFSFFFFFFFFFKWCFELLLVSMLCCYHNMVFMCWTYIHPLCLFLYWLHIRMIIFFAKWSL